MSKRLDNALKLYPDCPPIMAALVAMAAENPGLDPLDYGAGGDPNWRTYWRQDSRMATSQFHAVRDALRDCWLVDATDSAVIRASKSAWSGRISIDNGRISYCTGQYYPTEYRGAVAAVLNCAAKIARSENV